MDLKELEAIKSLPISLEFKAGVVIIKGSA